MKTLPSSAYSVASPIFQATVVTRRLEDGTARRAGVLQHEASGAVGVLGQAGTDATLAEERGLLISGDAGDAEFRRDPCTPLTSP